MTKEKDLLREAIANLDMVNNYFKEQPMMTPDEESLAESIEEFVGRAKKELKGVI